MFVIIVLQVGQVKDTSLTAKLTEYLLGETDGVAKVINNQYAVTPPHSLQFVSVVFLTASR